MTEVGTLALWWPGAGDPQAASHAQPRPRPAARAGRRAESWNRNVGPATGENLLYWLKAPHSEVPGAVQES
jgi:hypothetical protein